MIEGGASSAATYTSSWMVPEDILDRAQRRLELHGALWRGVAPLQLSVAPLSGATPLRGPNRRSPQEMISSGSRTLPRPDESLFVTFGPPRNCPCSSRLTPGTRSGSPLQAAPALWASAYRMLVEARARWPRTPPLAPANAASPALPRASAGARRPSARPPAAAPARAASPVRPPATATAQWALAPPRAPSSV